MADNNGKGRADAAFPPITLPFTLEALIEFNRPALAALAQMNGKVYDGIAAMNKNWAAFVNRRLKEDLAVPQQLGVVARKAFVQLDDVTPVEILEAEKVSDAGRIPGTGVPFYRPRRPAPSNTRSRRRSRQPCRRA